MIITYRRELAALALCIGLPVGTAMAGAPSVVIDRDGCQVVDGYNQINRCNSAARGDGKTFTVTHSDVRFVTSGTANTSAYASMYCSFGTALHQGAITTGQTLDCNNGEVDYARKSFCGSAPACGSK